MAIKQLSIYVENKPGALAHATGVLAAANVDIRSLCIADTSDFGIVRTTVDDTEKAVKAIQEGGLIANVRDVVAVAIPDRAGGLNEVLRILDENEINLEYAYSLLNAASDEAYIAFRADDTEKAEAKLRERGIRLLSEEDI